MDLSAENQPPLITEFPLFSVFSPSRACVMPLIAGFQTNLMSDHSTIYFHLFFKEMASITRKRIFQTSFSEDTIFIEREIEKKLISFPLF